jgi:hypothetical protein
MNFCNFAGTNVMRVNAAVPAMSIAEFTRINSLRDSGL